MKFGEVPVGEAEGAILAHSLRLGGTALKKGRVLSAADLEAIAAAGLDRVIVARLDPGDIREDAAAERIAAAAAGPNIATASCRRSAICAAISFASRTANSSIFNEDVGGRRMVASAARWCESGLIVPDLERELLIV